MDKNQQNTRQECTCVLAMAAIPMQIYGQLYEPEEALARGTVFKELDLPFFMGGGIDGRQTCITAEDQRDQFRIQ